MIVRVVGAGPDHRVLAERSMTGPDVEASLYPAEPRQGDAGKLYRRVRMKDQRGDFCHEVWWVHRGDGREWNEAIRPALAGLFLIRTYATSQHAAFHWAYSAADALRELSDGIAQPKAVAP